MKSKIDDQSERELEAAREHLVDLINSAHELFGSDASELRTSKAALKAITESLNCGRRRRNQRAQ